MIRRLKPVDAGIIEGILNKVPLFKKEDIKIAMELVKITAANPLQTDYNIFVYENNGTVLGYHCIGKRPLTDAVYDLYWIVTDPDHGKQGIGKSLLEHAEDFVLQNNGRWMLIETSAKESYSATRNFYLRNNYSIISEINDFYSKGESLLVFGKYFNNKNN
jgi:aminoglycoside 6'-N-acetyltransferase I